MYINSVLSFILIFFRPETYSFIASIEFVGIEKFRKNVRKCKSSTFTLDTVHNILYITLYTG